MKKIFLMLCLLSSVSFAREIIITPSLGSNYNFGFYKDSYNPYRKYEYSQTVSFIETDLDVKTPVYKKDKFSILVGGNLREGITGVFPIRRFFWSGPYIGIGPMLEFKYKIKKDLNIFLNNSFNIGGVSIGQDFGFYNSNDRTTAFTLSHFIKLGVDYKNWVIGIKTGSSSWFSKDADGYISTEGIIGLNIGYNFVLYPDKSTHKSKEIIPEVKEVAPEVKEVMPEVKEVAPVVKEVTPEVKEVMPEVKEVAPEVKEVMPEVKEVTPEVQEIVPENCSLEELKCTLNGFNVNDKNLTEDAQNKVDEVVSFLNNHVKEGSLKIYGYTDNSGKERYNQRLSAERAQSVSELLRARGLNPEIKFETISGKGEMDPVDSNNTSMGRFNNRRVSIYFMK